MFIEKWKDVVGYEGLYQVSDIGRVKSLFYGSKIGYEKIKIIKELLNKKITISRISQIINIDRSTIRRIKNNYYKEKILKPWRNKNGKKYRLAISLHNNKLKRRFYIHRLVASAFIGLCPMNMEVCHNDGNSENNYVNNLRYGTHKNNMEDMVLHNHSNVGTKNPNCKLTEIQLLKIIDLINNRISCADIADKFEISISTIYAIRRKHLWGSLTRYIRIDKTRIVDKQNI